MSEPEVKIIEVPEGLKQSISWTQNVSPPVETRNVKIVSKKTKKKTRKKSKKKNVQAPGYGYFFHRCINTRCKKKSYIRVPEPILRVLLQQAEKKIVPTIPDGMAVCDVKLYSKKGFVKNEND